MKNAKNAIVGCALILLSGVIGCENTMGTEDIEQDTLASGGGFSTPPELSYEWALDIAEDVTGFSDPVVIWVSGDINSSGILVQDQWGIGFRDGYPSEYDPDDYCSVFVRENGTWFLGGWSGGWKYEGISVSNAEIQDILDLVYDRVDILDPSNSVEFTMQRNVVEHGNTWVDVKGFLGGGGIPCAHLEFY